MSGKQQVVLQLKDLLSQSNELILAIDDDREGETINWHFSEVLKPAILVRRALFQEITPAAVLNTFQNLATQTLITLNKLKKRVVC